MQKITVSTSKRNEIIDITSEIKKAVGKSGKKDSICTVFVPHTSASVTINENADPNVQDDILDHLSRLVPQDSGFKHSENNSDAHNKVSLLGSSIQLLVENGEIMLGKWQAIMFCEFDGPRKREVWVKVI